MLAVDLKFGHNDYIACIKFCDFLDGSSIKSSNAHNIGNLPLNNSSLITENINQSNNSSNQVLPEDTILSNKNHYKINSVNNSIPDKKESSTYNSFHGKSISPIHQKKSLISINKIKLFNDFKGNYSHIKKSFSSSNNSHRFYIPEIISSDLATRKMKDLVQIFRKENLIFDIEKRNGVVLILPDVVESSMIGICGIANNKEELGNICKKTLSLFNNQIAKHYLFFEKDVIKTYFKSNSVIN